MIIKVNRLIKKKILCGEVKGVSIADLCNCDADDVTEEEDVICSLTSPIHFRASEECKLWRHHTVDDIRINAIKLRKLKRGPISEEKWDRHGNVGYFLKLITRQQHSNRDWKYRRQSNRIDPVSISMTSGMLLASVITKQLCYKLNLL